MLSGMIMVSPTTVEREIRFLLPLLWHYFKELVKWPTAQQWLQMANHWEMLSGAVAVIDGTRHEIQRPQTEPQQLFYSGHCCYHNFSTQIIMDNHGNIVFIQSGFLGHNNDSGQFYMIGQRNIDVFCFSGNGTVNGALDCKCYFASITADVVLVYCLRVYRDCFCQTIPQWSNAIVQNLVLHYK